MLHLKRNWKIHFSYREKISCNGIESIEFFREFKIIYYLLLINFYRDRNAPVFQKCINFRGNFYDYCY